MCQSSVKPLALCLLSLVGCATRPPGNGARPFCAQPQAGPTAGDRVTENMITLGEAMQVAGYQTALTGKWHLGSEAPDRPFDVLAWEWAGDCALRTSVCAVFRRRMRRSRLPPCARQVAPPAYGTL